MKKIVGLLTLARPMEWSKTFGNMIIAALIAANFTGVNWPLFLIGFFAIGPCLWGGLYALNDYLDAEKDKLHSVKKNRPIPSGVVPKQLALQFSGTLIILAFTIALAIAVITQNYLFLLCMIAMTINQWLYTAEPFKLKKRTILDLVSGSLINPLFRFFSGWVLFMPNFNAPILILVFVIALQFGGYSLYRLSGKKHEEELGYKSSAVVLGEGTIKMLSYAATGIGGIAFIAATFIGVLPFKFVWLAIGSVFLVPLYWNAMKDPQKMDMHFVYNLTYAHYILFIIGFMALALI